MIGLNDKKRLSNILPYTSVKAKRVARSVLAAELYSAFQAFDYASTLSLNISEIFRRLLTMTLYTDSQSLYEGILGMRATI